MEELNQNKNSKQLDGPDVVWKLTMGINQYHVQRDCLHVLYGIVFLEIQENFRKRLGSFLPYSEFM